MKAAVAPTQAKRERHTPEVRRALIIAAAQDVIADEGFPSASARVIAARSGCSLGTLSYHFDSVDALLMAALRDASARFTAEIVAKANTESGAVARLLCLIEGALPSSRKASRNWKLWLEYWARATHLPDLADLHVERYNEWRGSFADIIEAGVACGELRDVEPMQTAMTVVALLDGLGLHAVIGDPSSDVDLARRLLGDFVRSLEADRK